MMIKQARRSRATIKAGGDMSEVNEPVGEQSERASGYIVGYLTKLSAREI